jgi:hypothetical protein
MTILVVGNAELFDRPLSTMGVVNVLDVTIPGPGVAAAPAATPESVARGRELLLKAARAKGDAALAGLRDLTVDGVLAQETPTGPLEMKVKVVLAPPDRQYMQIATPTGETTLVQAGAAGWMKAGPTTTRLPENEAASMRRRLLLSFGCLGLLREALLGPVEAQALGPEVFEGQPAEVVLVRVGDRPVRVYVSPDGRQVLGAASDEQTQAGPARLVTVFTEAKAFGGLNIPLQTTTKTNGKIVGSARIANVSLNAGFDPALFAQPQESERTR